MFFILTTTESVSLSSTFFKFIWNLSKIPLYFQYKIYKCFGCTINHNHRHQNVGYHTCAKLGMLVIKLLFLEIAHNCAALYFGGMDAGIWIPIRFCLDYLDSFVFTQVFSRVILTSPLFFHRQPSWDILGRIGYVYLCSCPPRMC